jgi:colanic acid/amylovoran biosynthesis glycosyltransferase
MSQRIGYLTSGYPAVSHTFITREVEALRALGFDVRTFGIRRAPPETLLTDRDRRIAEETFAVFPVDRSRLLQAHVRALRSHPVRYIATLLSALRLSPGGMRAALWHLFYFVEAIYLWDAFDAEDVRHVHAHFANVASAVAMLMAVYDESMSWSFTMHGPTEFDDVTMYALAQKVRSAAFVACISDYCRAQLMKLVEPDHWSRLHVVRCGLDLEALGSPDTDRASSAGPLQVLCVGRLVPDKGQLVLLEAVAELRQRGIAVALTLVGDGPDRDALSHAATRLGIGASVTFRGSLGASDVAALYRAADVFCLPSFAEGLPVVLMEAMAHRVPVVTTRIAGVSELVDDGINGAVVPAGRVDRLTDALASLAADPDLRARWGEAGSERVRREYDIHTSAQRLAGLLRGSAVARGAHPAPRPAARGHAAEDAQTSQGEARSVEQRT